MTTVGLIGGLGPESTIDYYRAIIAGYRAQHKDDTYPSVIINSVNLAKLRDLVTANELGKSADYLVEEVQKLVRAGADFGLLAANTPHIVFDEVQRRVSLPLLSIVQATCDEVKRRGMKKVGLLGTRFTMNARFYKDAFTREGITLVVPHPKEQDYIHEKYLGELLNNIFKDETRQGLLDIAERMKKQDAIEGLILGGTELPLILTDKTRCSVPFLDTTQIHAQAVVDRILAHEGQRGPSPRESRL